MSYEEIYVVRQTIGDRWFTRNGAKNDSIAAEMATSVIKEEINTCYSTEKNGTQAWEVIVTRTVKPDDSEILALTLEEITNRLKDGAIIKYVDIDGAVCKVWLGTMKVFE